MKKASLDTSDSSSDSAAAVCSRASAVSLLKFPEWFSETIHKHAKYASLFQ